MPPKRTSTSTAPSITQAAIRQLVADSVATALEAQAATMARELAGYVRNMGTRILEKLIDAFIDGLPKSIKGSCKMGRHEDLPDLMGNVDIMDPRSPAVGDECGTRGNHRQDPCALVRCLKL
ncbi:hypothetical protein Tco_0296127, partial [Tanacetum coccineum]